MICAEKLVVRGPNKGQVSTGTIGGHLHHGRAGEPPCDPCAEAKAKYDKEYRQRNRDHLRVAYRNKHLRRIFGLTPEQYESMFQEQNGVCAICLNPPGPNMRLGVDHDHECCPTKESCGECIRGLLCQKCNSFLGRIKEDPTRLIAYLKKGGSHD